MRFELMQSYCRKVLFLVGSARAQLLMLLPFYIITSILDLVGLGLLVALISGLQDISKLRSYLDQIPVFSSFNLDTTPKELTIIFASTVLMVFMFRTGIAFLITKRSLQISFGYGSDLRSFLMGVYQNQTYHMFIQRNMSAYIQNIHSLAGQFVSYTIQPILKIFNDSILILTIILFLAFKDPLILITLLSLIFISAFLFDLAFRRKMTVIGVQDNKVSKDMIKSITEGLSSFRESQIFGIQEFFYRKVSDAANMLAKLRIRSQVITIASRYALEFTVIFSVICIIIISVMLDRDGEGLLATLALFLALSTRLLPAASQIATSVGNLRYGRHAVDVLYADITGSGYTAVDFSHRGNRNNSVKNATGNQKPFFYIELQNIYFRYSPEGQWILNGVNLRIEQYDIVGIIGKSGSGKSTLIELILGFLIPQHGRIILNGTDLAEPGVIEAWHRKVAYLPQEIMLIDDTIASNIAIGVEPPQIDHKKLFDSINKAGLGDFVAMMPMGVATFVGDKGLWVSGGQRQRIALARAFYFQAEVIVLDESTNALDAETTNQIISELRNLNGEVTIIIITHQNTLLEVCNKVYSLSEGRIELVRKV